MPREKYRPELVTRAAFARRTGRTKAAVTLACRGPLAPALVGRQIDAAHPAAKLYAEQAAATPTATRPAEPIPPPQPEQRDRTDLLEASMQRKRAEIGLLELKLAERRGELISRELVAHHVIGALKRLHLRLLNDLPRAVAGRLSGLDFEQRRKVILQRDQRRADGGQLRGDASAPHTGRASGADTRTERLARAFEYRDDGEGIDERLASCARRYFECRLIDIAAREILAGERPLRALLAAMEPARIETAQAIRDGRIPTETDLAELAGGAA